MSHLLPYKDENFTKSVDLEEFLKTDDFAGSGYSVEVDISCPDFVKETSKNFPLSTDNKKQTLVISLIIGIP